MGRISAIELGARLQAIADEATGRRERKLSPVESATGYIKRAVYDLVGKWTGPHSTLQDMLVAAGHRPARASALEGNPYHWVLLAIRRCGYEVVHTEMRRIANELEYANRHAVPVELVVGFLLQTGAGDDIYRRVQDATSVEPCMATYAPIKKRTGKTSEQPPTRRIVPHAKPINAIAKARQKNLDAQRMKRRQRETKAKIVATRRKIVRTKPGGGKD